MNSAILSEEKVAILKKLVTKIEYSKLKIKNLEWLWLAEKLEETIFKEIVKEKKQIKKANKKIYKIIQQL